MSSLGAFIARWLAPPIPGPPRGAPEALPSRTRSDRGYPALDPGLPAVSVDEVLRPQREWIGRLRDAYGADEATFQHDIIAVVERYAQCVHLVPATPDAYFRGAGGLLRMGLEVGLFALQATESAIFAGRKTITQRSALEPRWRYATFLAGLCSELHRTASHFTVTDDHGHEWPAYLQPLAPWLREHKARRYYVHWRAQPPEARGLGVVTMSHIVTPAILQYLAEGNAVVVPHLLASLSGTAPGREANTLDRLVRRASALVIDRDLRAGADRCAPPQLGSLAERDVVDAMRRLVARGEWRANGENSPLWQGQDGMFVLWPRGASDVIAVLQQQRSPGIPTTAQALAELLAAGGVIEPRADASLLWDGFVPGAAASAPALKIASPALLAGASDREMPPLPRLLLRPATSDGASSAGAQAELALPRPLAEPQRAPAATAEPAAAAPAAPPPVTLNAPPRLNPAVREALQQIIATLDSPAVALAAFVIDLGVFVPLREFERRSVDAALAVRALSDARMLVSDPRQPQSRTLSRDFHDEPVLGLVLARDFVAGLDPAACAQPVVPTVSPA
jgi:conjugal transfer pilus assembly protein TraI